MDNKQKPDFIEDIRNDLPLGPKPEPTNNRDTLLNDEVLKNEKSKDFSDLSRKSGDIDYITKNSIPTNRSMLNANLSPILSRDRVDYGKKKAPKTSKFKWFGRHKIVSSVLVLLVLIVGVSSYFGARIIGDLDKLFHGNIFSDFNALFSTTRLNGESQGRVNILLAGYQGSNSDEGALTDSIMVVSIDTKNNTAFMLSIPRDLIVKFHNSGYEKINYANTVSNFNQPGYFNGGMGELQYVIEQDFHIPINYYALINYKAFEDAVNAVGGITVNIQSPDPRGLYDPNVDKAHGGPVRLPNGPVQLNGIHALALALARGDSPYAYGFPLSDINREQHQRQMLVALEKKALSAGVLSNPLTVTHLVDALGNNINTNLSLADALRLSHFAKVINLSQIKSYGLSYSGPNNLLKTFYYPKTGDSLIPKAGLGNYTQIQNYYQSIVASENSIK